MIWQDWLRGEIKARGLHETSGYRTVAEEEALHGPPSSYHCRGTVAAPGAIDVGGPAVKLAKLFYDCKTQYHGYINELFLNIPGGNSEAIKEGVVLAHNPEAGRAKHLHVALRDLPEA